MLTMKELCLSVVVVMPGEEIWMDHGDRRAVEVKANLSSKRSMHTPTQALFPICRSDP